MPTATGSNAISSIRLQNWILEPNDIGGIAATDPISGRVSAAASATLKEIGHGSKDHLSYGSGNARHWQR
jgi:hypothetical protein